MGARLRQEEKDARIQPAKGPVQSSKGRALAERVGGVPRDAALTEREQQEVRKLKKRDAEVRQHEHAHLAAAGAYSKGPPSYDYETGPDGKRYAVGGHVNIDTSPIPDSPEATIQKARVIRRAALAPKDPSSQDHQVASEAVQLERQARRELEQQRRDKMTALSVDPSNDRQTPDGGQSSPDLAVPGASSDSHNPKQPSTTREPSATGPETNNAEQRPATIRPSRPPVLIPSSGRLRRLASMRGAVGHRVSVPVSPNYTGRMDAPPKSAAPATSPVQHFDRYA